MDIKSREQLVIDVIKWIIDNIDNDLSITIIANKAGYSKWYFQRMFKSVCGITIGRFVSAIKISKAKLTLDNSNMKIIDVSIIYGFSSQQSFTRWFKKHSKITPSDYKKTLTDY